MANLDIAERFVPQDGRIGISLGDRMVDIRVSLLPTQHGERIVMRLLDKARGLLSIEELGMKPDERKRLYDLIRRLNGMILFTDRQVQARARAHAILQALARPETSSQWKTPSNMISCVGQVQVNEKDHFFLSR